VDNKKFWKKLFITSFVAWLQIVMWFQGIISGDPTTSAFKLFKTCGQLLLSFIYWLWSLFNSNENFYKKCRCL